MANEVRASHILVNSQDEATKIKARIDAGEPFETLAKAHSTCPSSRSGGDLGWFGHGRMVKPFEDACFSLSLDSVSEPVQTQFGYHIIKVTGQR
jgi:parvulin-like peptidyl-prolyl isomerase